MDTVCEGGAECACSDRTDAHVEHGERRNVHARTFCVSCCLSCGSLARITMNLEAGVGWGSLLLLMARRQRQAKASSRRIVHVKTRLDERYCVKVLSVHTCTGLGDQFSDILCRKFVLENSLFS